jgi:biopolymer transport protein ExbD
MPRVKIARKSTATDMTAMCDVAFLLLTFFIMTSKFKADDPVPVAIPSYTHVVPLPEENNATLTVGKGQVYFSVDGDKIRASTLEQVGQLYSITFTPEEKAMFVTLPTIGMDIQQLKPYLQMLISNPEKAKTFPQPGIPLDTVSNQLYNWVREARKADAALNQKSLLISIKGDKKEEYPTIGKIIAILQKQKVNKFSLITASRGM